MPRTKESGIDKTIELNFGYWPAEVQDVVAALLAENERLREVADAASDFMDDPGETNEKIDRLNDALDALASSEDNPNCPIHGWSRTKESGYQCPICNQVWTQGETREQTHLFGCSNARSGDKIVPMPSPKESARIDAETISDLQASEKRFYDENRALKAENERLREEFAATKKYAEEGWAWLGDALAALGVKTVFEIPKERLGA